MNTQNILVAGLGNIFLGDDGFGVHVADRLASRLLPPQVKVVDFGIKGFDLAYALLDQPDLVILVDAAQGGFPPGTVHVIEPELENPVSPASDSSPQTHSMVPTRAIGLAKSMGAAFGIVRIVACEPETFGSPGLGHEGLSPSVAAAVDEAVAVIEALIHDFLLACTNSR